MRKILYILPPVALALCLVLVLMMTGVLNIPQYIPPQTTGTEPLPTTHTPTFPTPTADPADTKPNWTPQAMISISLPEMTDTIVSQDGVTLFRHTFQDVVISSPNAQINEAVTLDLLRRMDAGSASVAQLADLVQYYTPGTAWNTLYYEILYTPMRVDGAVLSLVGTEAVYPGSGYASHSSTCVNYHMATGSVMTLSQVLSEESGSQDGLLQALLAVLKENAEDWALFEDYSESVTRYFPSYLQQDSIWYFSPEGLNICFAPYEIAPHASGTIVATVPYGALTGILRSDLFPTQQSPVSAAPSLLDFATAPLDPYTHFSECILTEDGKNHLLTTDTVLYDVRLELGEYDWDAGSFTPSSTVLAANSLCNDQAILLCWNENQQLRLHCKAGGAEQSFLLRVDAAGSAVLQHLPG